MSDTQKDKKDVQAKKTDSNLQSNFSSFLKNEYHTFSVLKSEKLASALYMITGFVSENDPLRTRLRTCALDLVSCAVDLHKAREGGGYRVFGSRCLEIGSMLSMAERAGLVSSMNAKILCDEYAILASFVEQNADRVFGNGGIDVSAHLPVSPKPRAQISLRGAVYNGHPVPQVKKTNNYKRHQNRRDEIMSLLNKKDKLTIKDVSNAIDGCSEKTIQRELISMVEEGVLLREGKRRWSTYRKAS